MSEFADKVMAKFSGSAEPDGDEAAGPTDPGSDEASDGDVAIAAINKNDGAAFEAAVRRICGK
jgi:hypothetical protein